MKRETLRNLGIDDELVSAVMTEHGKTVERIKTGYQEEINELKTDLANTTQKNTDLEAKQANVDDYKQQLEEAQQRAGKAENELKNTKIDRALAEAGATDVEYAKYKLGEVEDIEKLSEKIEALKADIPSHFKVADEEESKPTHEIFGRTPATKGVGTPEKQSLGTMLGKQLAEKQNTGGNNV